LRRGDRWRLRRREGHRRRPRVRLGCVEGVHAPADQHHQLLRLAAAGPGHPLRPVADDRACPAPGRPRTHATPARHTHPHAAAAGFWNNHAPHGAHCLRSRPACPGGTAIARLPLSRNPAMNPIRQTSSLAITSLVAGILGWSLVPFLGTVVAIVTGHMARKEIRNSAGHLDGDGLAIGGLVLGWLAVATWLVGVLVLFLFLGGVAWLVSLG